MRNFLLGGILGGVIGAMVGALGMLIAFPYLFPPAPANEQLTSIESRQLLADGQFIHPDPDDAVHWGKGGVEIYRAAGTTEVFLKSDFKVGPGPAFHIYLSSQKGLRNKDDFDVAAALDLGKLRAFEGSQVYSTTKPLDGYNSVVVWCKAFNQLITVADL